jgi:Ankyrin repeats (3 copies)/Ankyrin repeats (many copies)
MSFWKKLLDSPNAKILEAARNGDLEEVTALLKRDASVFTQDSTGLTPLHLASMNGHREVVEILLANGSDPTGFMSRSDDGRPPLCSAALNGHKGVVALLLTKGAKVNEVDRKWRTALHEMAGSGNKEIAELLLTNKADVNAEDKEGMTPLCYAEAKGYHELAQLLRLHGGIVPSKIQNATTPTNPIQAKMRRSVAKARELVASGGVRVEGKGHEIRIEISMGGLLYNRDIQATKNLRSKVGHTTKWFPSEHSGGGEWRFETGRIYENNIEQVPEKVEYALHSLCDTGFLNDATISWIDYSTERPKNFDDNEKVEELSRTRIWPP